MRRVDRRGPKCPWTTPTLIIHGALPELTQRDKKVGPTDGFILAGIGTIAWAS
ncbi:MAG: hypothetical protein AB1505_25815 [Candidatus Latescibacterota bacterium]